jgi:hypothetical protein
MLGDPEVDDLPSSVADHKPGVQQAEPSGGDDREVHCDDALPVILKERLPSLALIVVRTPLRNRSPVKPNTFAMPADDGVGLDDDQGVFPTPQIRDRKTQKVRSTEVIRGLGPFRANVASC